MPWFCILTSPSGEHVQRPPGRRRWELLTPPPGMPVFKYKLKANTFTNLQHNTHRTQVRAKCLATQGCSRAAPFSAHVPSVKPHC